MQDILKSYDMGSETHGREGIGSEDGPSPEFISAVAEFLELHEDLLTGLGYRPHEDAKDGHQTLENMGVEKGKER